MATMTDTKMIEEFKRWVKANRPKVWYKKDGKDTEWSTVTIPSWSAGLTYVVYDEYAELRKAYEDGKIIQSLYGKEWVDTETPDWTGAIKYYRIKPNDYEWQWLVESYEYGTYTVTAGFYTTEEEVSKRGFTPFKKIEETRRKVK